MRFRNYARIALPRTAVTRDAGPIPGPRSRLTPPRPLSPLRMLVAEVPCTAYHSAVNCPVFFVYPRLLCLVKTASVRRRYRRRSTMSRSQLKV